MPDPVHDGKFRLVADCFGETKLWKVRGRETTYMLHCHPQREVRAFSGERAPLHLKLLPKKHREIVGKIESRTLVSLWLTSSDQAKELRHWDRADWMLCLLNFTPGWIANLRQEGWPCFGPGRPDDYVMGLVIPIMFSPAIS